MPDSHAPDLPGVAGQDSTESTIVVPDERTMLGLLGSRDVLLRQMEQNLAADIHVRGNRITLRGSSEDVALAARAIQELLALQEAGTQLTPDAVRRTIGMLSEVGEPTAAPGETPAQVLGLNIVSRRGRTIRPKTVNQKRYVDAIDEHTIVFGIGPAGTGKTYLAMAKAVQALQTKQVSRIILTRPAVEAGERLGYLPGTLSEKIDPYLRPLYDALHDMLDPESIPRLMAAGTIEVAPLAYMRGRTLNDAFIILDEAQNTTPEQMKMFLTRLGFGSKIVVTGDVTQVDLPGGQQSGLRVVEGILTGIDDVHFSTLTSQDVVPAPAGRPHRRRLRPMGCRRRRAAGPARLRPIRPGRPARRRGPRIGSPGRSAHRVAPWRQRPRAAEMTIEVANESGVTVDELALVSVSRFALDRMGINPMAELSLILMDVDAMSELHVKWMDEPGPTDVMSFPMDELDTARSPDEPGAAPALLGDVVLCPAVALEQAGQAGHSLDDELHLLTVHGILHLLGYDHAEPTEEREMFRLQNELLDAWRDQRTAERTRREREVAAAAEQEREQLRQRRLSEIDDAVLAAADSLLDRPVAPAAPAVPDERG